HPAAVATRSTDSPDASLPHPATISPRGWARTASATRVTVASSGARVGRVTVVHGRPSARPGASTSGAPGGTNGSRNATLSWTGPAGGPTDSARARAAVDRHDAAA